MQEFFTKNKIVIAILVGSVIVGGAIYLSRSPESPGIQPTYQFNNAPSEASILDSITKSPQGANTSCVIKGNISSGGEIYHLPECASYDKTVINENAGEKWFCTETEAVSAGWRKAKNCP
ncbi:hypothetical protein HYV91_01925 [Candidatus Wolfebacteria bacterium]|nr:hypothetical protein [Candidatus Wolfebacteria bacterium]